MGSEIVGRPSLHLVELGRVDPRRVVVEQQLVAALGYGHGPDPGHFEHVLNRGTAVDVHCLGVCPGLQQHLHQHVVAVPGRFVESGFVVLFSEVGILRRRKMFFFF